MASPRIKDIYQEAALSGARVVAFTTVILVVGFSAWFTAVVAGASWGLAAAIGGSIAGFVGFVMLACGSLYEIKTVTCQSCGQSDKTLKEIGYYNCASCGEKYYVCDNEIKGLSA